MPGEIDPYFLFSKSIICSGSFVGSEHLKFEQT
jgi:hypothetical protein